MHKAKCWCKLSFVVSASHHSQLHSFQQSFKTSKAEVLSTHSVCHYITLKTLRHLTSSTGVQFLMTLENKCTEQSVPGTRRARHTKNQHFLSLPSCTPAPHEATLPLRSWPSPDWFLPLQIFPSRFMHYSHGCSVELSHRWRIIQ